VSVPDTVVGTRLDPAVDATPDPLARARDLLGVSRLSDTALTRWLHGLPGVDQVGVRGPRGCDLGTRSIKKAQARAIDLAISMIDLTTLEGADTPGKVRGLAAKAAQPRPRPDPTHPEPAAVCVYGDMVPPREVLLGGTSIRHRRRRHRLPQDAPRMAGQARRRGGRRRRPAPRDRHGHRPRAPSWPADYGTVFDQIVAVKAACGGARLKVIMETGELVTYDNVRRASWLSMLAGGDFIKTSTGKISPAATLPVTLIMLEAVRDWREATGQQLGRQAGRRASAPARTRSSSSWPSTRSPGRTGWTTTGSASERPACWATCILQRQRMARRLLRRRLRPGRLPRADLLTLRT
jgi:deoxyribose-phosphate aldolase